MDKRSHYYNCRKNLSLLRGGQLLSPQEDYICPLCMKSFPSGIENGLLTEEDVPQKSLGGQRITLTCKKCNNTCGTKIDIHLLEAIKGIEQRAFLPGTNRRVSVNHEGKRLNAFLEVVGTNDFLLNVNTKWNDPKVWEDYRAHILLEKNIINVQDAPLKRNLRRISSALLKNAYLILYARTGYTFLADVFYNNLRRQIMEPEPFILPERLWTFQNVSVPDGIYLTRDNRYRGFFVVYSLYLQNTYRVCVLIPTPNVGYLQACYELQKINSGTHIHVCRLPENLDFLCDLDAINQLRRWCYGWNLDF